jgi:MarR family transcriptional regulator for hemolysin
MARPAVEPIGLQLARTAKSVGRAFDEALAAAGGSVPSWLVLVSLKAGGHGMQRELAESVGIEGPTLTHHLNRMEADGVVRRTRQPDNRRVQVVELTDAGEQAFSDQLGAVGAFDQRLRRALTATELSTLRDLLNRLQRAVTAQDATDTEQPA